MVARKHHSFVVFLELLFLVIHHTTSVLHSTLHEHRL